MMMINNIITTQTKRQKYAVYTQEMTNSLWRAPRSSMAREKPMFSHIVIYSACHKHKHPCLASYDRHDELQQETSRLQEERTIITRFLTVGVALVEVACADNKEASSAVDSTIKSPAKWGKWGGTYR